MRKVFKYVWNQVHGAQGPSFKWDDAAKVNGDRKFGLMLKNGSEWADMIELKITVTREGGGSAKIRADDPNVNVYDHIFQHDRIRLRNPNPAGPPQEVLLKVAKQQRGEPLSVIAVDGTGTLAPPKNTGSSETGWSVHRNRVRPSGKARGLDNKLLKDGLESYDICTLVAFLAEDYALGLSRWLKTNHKSIMEQIVSAKTDRNDLLCHQSVGLLETSKWVKCCTEYGGLIAACVQSGLLHQHWNDKFARDMQCLNDQAPSNYVPPATTAYTMITRRGERIKQLTGKQAELFKNLTDGMYDRDQHPRWKIQAPSGSGKTLLCVTMALSHVAKRVRVHRNLADDSDAKATEVRDRFLLITHSVTLVGQCVNELVGENHGDLRIERVVGPAPPGEADWVELKSSEFPKVTVAVVTIDALTRRVLHLEEHGPGGQPDKFCLQMCTRAGGV